MEGADGWGLLAAPAEPSSAPAAPSSAGGWSASTSMWVMGSATLWEAAGNVPEAAKLSVSFRSPSAWSSGTRYMVWKPPSSPVTVKESATSPEASVTEMPAPATGAPLAFSAPLMEIISPLVAASGALAVSAISTFGGAGSWGAGCWGWPGCSWLGCWGLGCVVPWASKLTAP